MKYAEQTHIVLPNGQTTAEYILPQNNEVYRLGERPPMPPMLNGGRE